LAKFSVWFDFRLLQQYLPATAETKRHIEGAKTIHDAMTTIEDDVQANGGIYPLNNGVISIQELLRRAEKSAGNTRLWAATAPSSLASPRATTPSMSECVMAFVTMRLNASDLLMPI
jgi:hypothetical protein